MKTINIYQIKENSIKHNFFLFMLSIVLAMGLMFIPSIVSQAQDTTKSQVRKIKRRVIKRADTIRTLRVRPMRALKINKAEIREALARPEVRAALKKGAPGVPVNVEALIAHKIRPQSVIGAGNNMEQHDVAPPAIMYRPLNQARVQEILAVENNGITINRAVIDNFRARERLEQGNRGRVFDDAARRQMPDFGPLKPNLDVPAFTASMHAAFVGRVASYMWQLNQNGQAIAIGQWDWARRPQDGGLGWDPIYRDMHVASVSKLMTAIALVNLLEEKNISYNTPIISYLPSYWDFGPNIELITFRHLLRHRSGIQVPGSATDYWTMRQEIEAGVSVGFIGQGHYENANYGLMRILIPIIHGSVKRSALHQKALEIGSVNPTWIDQWWDLATVNAYSDYVRNSVFVPAGAPSPVMQHGSNDALAYSFPPSGGHGWDSGNLKSVSGGAGWIMSVVGVLRVMDEFRRGSGIVSQAVAQQALDSGFGIDVIINTPAGKLYNKNGRWTNGAGQTEQCVAFFLPDNMELVVFVNSPIGTQGYSLRNIVRQLYIANLK